MNLSNDMQIVPVTSFHISRIAALEKECFSDPWSEYLVRSELLNPQSVCFAAEQNGKLIGYIGMRHICDEGHINNLAVKPEYRRQGVAKMLMNRLMFYAWQHRLAFLTLEVRPSNLPAISLYTSYGFIKAGERKNYYEAPRENALLLTKYFESGDALENSGY